MQSAPARGLAYVLVAGTLWGLNGLAIQLLLQRHGLSPQWLVMVRLALTGLILLVAVRPKPPPRSRWLAMILIGVIGLAAAQFTFYSAIARSNATTATFLEYLFIPMIAGWQLARREVAFSPALGVSLGCSLVGTALLAAGGRAHLALSPAALGFGLAAAVIAAYYTLGSVPLVRELGALPTTTWGFLVGAVPMLVWALPATRPPAGPGLENVALLAFVIVAGTLFPFALYMAALRLTSATRVGVAVTVEPVVTAAGSVLLLSVVLEPLQYLGGALILIAVLLLRRAR